MFVHIYCATAVMVTGWACDGHGPSSGFSSRSHFWEMPFLFCYVRRFACCAITLLLSDNADIFFSSRGKIDAFSYRRKQKAFPIYGQSDKRTDGRAGGWVAFVSMLIGELMKLKRQKLFLGQDQLRADNLSLSIACFCC